MDQEEALREKLKAIRELMYSKHEPQKFQVLELTEDDLFDYQQDETYKPHSHATKKENSFVNEILTHSKDNIDTENLDKHLVSSENAAKSIETLKYLIKKLEKTTAEANKIKQNITIEEAVNEALKPFLKDWLNEYLHSIVQRIVDKEVQNLIAKNDRKND
jgi:cell pole-organizing protein PopZ